MTFPETVTGPLGRLCLPDTSLAELQPALGAVDGWLKARWADACAEDTRLMDVAGNAWPPLPAARVETVVTPRYNCNATRLSGEALATLVAKALGELAREVRHQLDAAGSPQQRSKYVAVALYQRPALTVAKEDLMLSWHLSVQYILAWLPKVPAPDKD